MPPSKSKACTARQSMHHCFETRHLQEAEDRRDNQRSRPGVHDAGALPRGGEMSSDEPSCGRLLCVSFAGLGRSVT